MTDRDFYDVRDRSQEWAEVVEVQIVSGIYSEPNLLSGSRGGGVLGERCIALRCCEVASIRFGVELDAVCSGRGNVWHCFRRWVHEDRDADAGGSQRRDDSLQQVGLSHNIPAVIRGPLIGSVRDQRALLRSDFVDEAQKVVGGVALNVELDAEFAGELPQFMHVAGARVPFIRARMDGDPGGSGGDAQASESADVGQAVVACVSQQGDFVEVRAEGGHRGLFVEHVCNVLGIRWGGDVENVPHVVLRRVTEAILPV